MYEFILLKGKGAMHSSKGTALSAGEMLQMTPPEVLRYLIMKHQPNKHLTFDPGFGLLNLVDDYDQLERVYFDEEEEIKGMKDLDTVYELSQPTDITTQITIQNPYRHLVTIVQISNNWKEIQKMLQRTNQLPETITSKDEKRLQQRIDHVCYWLENFAPKAIRFNVKKQLPDQPLTKEQQTVLRLFLEQATTLSWDPETIHNTIYSIAEKQKISAKIAFQSIYTVILDQKKGPRIGYFLSNLEKDFVINRFKEAVK
jgi:lysyl-tRNA synthetase class 1